MQPEINADSASPELFYPALSLRVPARTGAILPVGFALNLLHMNGTLDRIGAWLGRSK